MELGCGIVRERISLSYSAPRGQGIECSARNGEKTQRHQEDIPVTPRRKMVSLSIHASNLSILTNPLNTTISSKPISLFSPKPINPLFLSPQPAPPLKATAHPFCRHQTLPPPASAAAAETLETSGDAVADPEVADEKAEESERLRVVVKGGMTKPRLVLRFIWMEKNIGLALDQVIPGHGTVPLSPYYWWPRKDAWEELKAKLEEKPWISQKRMIILLNQATDIINLWQQSSTAAL